MGYIWSTCIYVFQTLYSNWGISIWMFLNQSVNFNRFYIGHIGEHVKTWEKNRRKSNGKNTHHGQQKHLTVTRDDFQSSALVPPRKCSHCKGHCEAPSHRNDAPEVEEIRLWWWKTCHVGTAGGCFCVFFLGGWLSTTMVSWLFGDDFQALRCNFNTFLLWKSEVVFVHHTVDGRNPKQPPGMYKPCK